MHAPMHRIAATTFLLAASFDREQLGLAQRSHFRSKWLRRAVLPFIARGQFSTSRREGAGATT